jgi:nicotinamide phosphoribosyltransferase
MMHYNARAFALFGEAVNFASPVFDTDSYKLSHYKQYPAGTTNVSSYIEARSPWGDGKYNVFFGLQIELAKLQGQVVTQQDLDEAKEMLAEHGYEINTVGWQHIIDKHNGVLPVEIDALDEGILVPVSVPQLRIKATDPACFWLVSYLETRLLRAIWYATTVATVSHNVVSKIREKMMITDGTAEGAEFKLHDFGGRGASSFETAVIGGCAHLINSYGTDTTPALGLARNIYGARMAGYSIPASEHSTMTALGEAGELKQFERMLEEYPEGLVACVSDSYDLFRAVKDYWGTALKDKVLGRKGTLVVRPDSGDPLEIVPDVIEALMAKFGCTVNAQGYRVLPEQVRVIQGDGVNPNSIVKIMDVLIERRIAISNIAFGMGGALLQKVDRDCFAYAMKASAIEINGVWRDVFKDPKTAKGSKTSKKGIQGAMRTDSGNFAARPAANIPKGADALTPVYRNGEILKIHRFDEIRARAWPGIAGFDLAAAA